MVCRAQTGLGEIFSPPFHKFWQANSPESVVAAVQQIKETLLNKGPFDGAFAFSEGAAALLSALIQDGMQASVPKFLVLVAPFPPFDISGRQRLDHSMTERPIVEIPTILIEGAEDPFRPLVHLAIALLPHDRTTVIEWGGGHAVPNSRENLLWEMVVNAILSK
ncbi:MAG: hypothetical protein Q9191_000157 [Dirinaria sp. TL-2023a]